LKKVMFISSTGGHLYELFQLKPLFKDYDYHIVTEKTKTNTSLKEEYKDRISYLKYGTKHKMYLYWFIFPYNCLKSLFLFLINKPDVIITTGAHTGIPMCYLGYIFKRKVIFIETFANKETRSLSGKIAYRIADHFIVQWEEMLELYPKAIYIGWIF